MLFVGPMSKNVVDTAIELSLKDPSREVTFIPSRRQIEYCGGYVNYWTTADFCKYVKSKNPKIRIERDHGGPGQGAEDDDGYYSLEEDCKYMDLIHIDPWKKYKTLEEGTKWTTDMIRFCNERNPSMRYEIGTEEAIRPFTTQDLEVFVSKLKDELDSELFSKIEYLVIQCGTGLCERTNTGSFDGNRLSEMLALAEKYGLTAKEHNGDWVSSDTNSQKRNIGLENINIAPEFGEIETRVILDTVNEEEFEEIFEICLRSGKWKKWVSADFDPRTNKRELVLIAGHYIFAIPEFVKIKNRYPNIDMFIKSAIMNKFYSLLNIYTVRTECVFCNCSGLITMYETDYSIPLSQGLHKQPLSNAYFMPYNILSCSKCKTVQTKYLGDLNIIYNGNHIDSFGSTKSKMHSEFSEFVTYNKNINGIAEVGACSDALPNDIVCKLQIDYHVIDPSYTGLRDTVNVIDKFVENVDLSVININTIIMSSVFEHIYNPIKLLEQLAKSTNIKYIYINHPNFDYDVKNNVQSILNSEHTFFIEHHFLISAFSQYGFQLNRRKTFENHSVFFEFVRTYDNIAQIAPIINMTAVEDIKMFYDRNIYTSGKLNTHIKNSDYKQVYVWPASSHSIPLFVCGLDHTRITGLLDNSPNKIGKYMYGYNLRCDSFSEVVDRDEHGTCIIISGAGSYCKEISINAKNIKVINTNILNDLHAL